jgi:cyclopropane fatty-acyl-phospholipid synthase-like methyltransferase
MTKQLLLGCGSAREKRLGKSVGEEWDELTTLDYYEGHNPDVLWDLTEYPYPFEDDTFDEIHAYEVLEHLGQQGDYRAFFTQFSEFHRILRDGGLFLATCPWWDSKWAWGDPSHTRVIQPETLTFLDQDQYEQVGQTPMSDFRGLYKADFKLVWMDRIQDTFAFALQASK